MVAVTIAALFALGPAGDAHVDASLRAAQGARSTDFADAPDLARAELEVVPRLGLRTDGQLRLELGYAPSLLVPADLAGNTPGLSGALDERGVVLHRATARAEFPVERWRLQTSGAVVAGETLLVGEPTGGTRAVEPASTTARLPTFGVDGMAGAVGEPTPRTTWSIAATFGRSGGEGEAARRRLPLLQSLGASTNLAYRFAPRHVLGLEAAANVSRLGEEHARDSAYLRAGATWSHELAPQTTLRTATGVAIARQLDDTGDALEDEAEDPVLPWLEGALELGNDPPNPSIQLALGVEPTVDRFRGDVGARGTARAGLGWAPLRAWSFAAGASLSGLFGAGDSWTGPSTRLGMASLSASYQLAEELRLTGSGRTTLQDTDRGDLPNFREEVVLLELEAGLFSL